MTVSASNAKRATRGRIPTIPHPGARWYSVGQLAARYGVSTDSIWRWSRLGKYPQPVRLSDSCTRWRAEEVEAHDRATAAA